MPLTSATDARRTRLTLLSACCSVRATAAAVGTVAGSRYSLEVLLGTGTSMFGVASWGGTLYFVGIEEDGWAWFEFKRANRPPAGAGGLGFRWQWDAREGEYSLGVPLWLVAALLFWLAWTLRRRLVRQPDGRCANCGYDLRATPTRCPECGTPAAAAP